MRRVLFAVILFTAAPWIAAQTPGPKTVPTQMLTVDSIMRGPKLVARNRERDVLEVMFARAVDGDGTITTGCENSGEPMRLACSVWRSPNGSSAARRLIGHRQVASDSSLFAANGTRCSPESDAEMSRV